MDATGLYHPVDCDLAHDRWGANCGPAAFAALLGRPVMSVRSFFPAFPGKPWVNPTGMKIDARCVQDRLDDVLGVEGWTEEYRELADGSVTCRLSCKLGGEWITKQDVGSPSEQPDGGDRLKAAYSDALKRAAVKFGVGRYLYRLPAQWADYDPQKRQFARPPQLPVVARPAPRPAPAADKVPAKKGAAPAKPADGSELKSRLEAYEAKLVALGVCAKGALLRHVSGAGHAAGYGHDLAKWKGPAIDLAIEETKLFEAACAHAAPLKARPLLSTEQLRQVTAAQKELGWSGADLAVQLERLNLPAEVERLTPDQARDLLDELDRQCEDARGERAAIQGEAGGMFDGAAGGKPRHYTEGR
jgi:hypothetical protein